MAAPRGTVTIGALALVAEIEQYQPFSEVALGVRAFDGIAGDTLQDFGFRASRQEGRLSSGGGTSPGLITTAQLASLLALVRTWGATQSITDSLGNAGTIKALTFASGFAYQIPGGAGALHTYTLTWRWVTLTTLYGVAYTGD